MSSKWVSLLIAVLVFFAAGALGEFLGRIIEKYAPASWDVANIPVRKGLGFAVTMAVAFMLLGRSRAEKTAAAPAAAVPIAK